MIKGGENVSEFNRFFNEYPYTNYHELNLDYIFQKMNELQKSIEGILENSEKYTDDEIARIKLYVDENIQSTTNLIKILSSKVDENYSKNIAYTDSEISKNNEYIISEVSNNFELIKVTNYFTGEKVSVQDMFNFLAGLHAVEAITYEELVTRELGYSYLISLQVLYQQIAVNGKEILKNE